MQERDSRAAGAGREAEVVVAAVGEEAEMEERYAVVNFGTRLVLTRASPTIDQMSKDIVEYGLALCKASTGCDRLGHRLMVGEYETVAVRPTETGEDWSN